MTLGLGLLVDRTHAETIAALAPPPVSFGADVQDVPDFESPIPVLNQLRSSSCVGHSGAANFCHRQWVETGEIVRFSPWFSYITAQKRGGYLGEDGGTSVKSAIDAATLDGCCLESQCKLPPGYDRSNRCYDSRLSQEAISFAASHRHLGKPVDLRRFEDLMVWLYDLRSAIIGTKWTGGMAEIDGVETVSSIRSGQFLGYHARAITGHRRKLPVVLNSHGSDWSQNGRAVIDRDAWEEHCKDPNFAAFGFTDFDEILPVRKDLSQYSFILPDFSSIG